MSNNDSNRIHNAIVAEVERRIAAGLISEDTHVRIDNIGAYEIYVRINPSDPFDVELINQYFFTVSDLVIKEEISN